MLATPHEKDRQMPPMTATELAELVATLQAAGSADRDELLTELLLLAYPTAVAQDS